MNYLALHGWVKLRVAGMRSWYLEGAMQKLGWQERGFVLGKGGAQ